MSAQPINEIVQAHLVLAQLEGYFRAQDEADGIRAGKRTPTISPFTRQIVEARQGLYDWMQEHARRFNHAADLEAGRETE